MPNGQLLSPLIGAARFEHREDDPRPLAILSQMGPIGRPQAHCGQEFVLGGEHRAVDQPDLGELAVDFRAAAVWFLEMHLDGRGDLEDGIGVLADLPFPIMMPSETSRDAAAQNRS